MEEPATQGDALVYEGVVFGECRKGEGAGEFEFVGGISGREVVCF